MKPSIKILTAKSKKGNDYSYLQVKIGAYEGRLFPTPGELELIRIYQRESAHKDFNESVEKDED